MNNAPTVTGSEIDRFHTYLRCQAYGRANAATAREINDDLHLGPNYDRLLRAVKHAANEAGLLICADNAGYFIPATLDEAAESIGRMRSQGLEMIQLANLLERLAADCFHEEQGQPALFSLPVDYR